MILLLFTCSPTFSVDLPDDPVDFLLQETLTAMQARQWQEAHRNAEILIEQFPTFKPGSLLQQDIAQHKDFNPINIAPLSPKQDEFIPDNLYAEITLRNEHWRHPPPENSIPGILLTLSLRHPYLLLVDAAASRLYLLENKNGTPERIADYYVGLGKQGIQKNAEGDHKTPIGIYTIIDHYTDNQLGELYGIGAYPLDYPNQWDHLKNRTGSGIWLHGVPRTTYSRPPRSSRGCVTISNQLFALLGSFIQIKNTPLILADRLVWLTRAEWQSQNQHRQLLDKIQEWELAWESLDIERYLATYHSDFKTQKMNLKTWENKKRKTHRFKNYIQIDISDIDLIRYPGEKDLILTRFTQTYKSNNYHDIRNKEQYWQRTESGWKIILEKTL